MFPTIPSPPARRRPQAWRRFVQLGVALSLIPVTAPAAGEVRLVQLATGEELRGLVVPSSPCTVILQTDDICLELPVDQIRKVDGQEDLTALLADRGDPILRAETFEEIRENGDLLLHTSFARENRGTATRDRIGWGVAPHELELLDHWQVFDEFGNELPIRVESGEEGRRHATATLRRPIVPGETLRYASRILFRDYVKEEDGVLVYRHRGDYPETRFVTKMVRLPAGAHIVSVSPPPAQRLEVEGAPCILWRRLYARGEVQPLEIRYRL